jgi:superfamily I DNA and/or RNA helicase
VRKLEELTTQSRGASAAGAGSTAVIAFSVAQVELIRLLVRRSALLKGSKDCLAIGLPDGFAHQEFDRVLVSFTRSHGHRAVPLAERFRDIVLTLTRARQQLILFTDLGTLARRTEFAGRIEHLDEFASAREARFAADLLGYFRQTILSSSLAHSR